MLFITKKSTYNKENKENKKSFLSNNSQGKRAYKNVSLAL